ncbi:MAG: PTS system mannose/fructose/sorbose family transporter subunit IID [Deltaproteobacteria bacterium]|nr:PTS system mannose/fructose/sorbose family transporter subunit IID [Deltaproteobacteria bacterium]
MVDAPTSRLGWPILMSVAFRSLFLEASWNLSGQQNIGYAASINPALKSLYKNRPEDLAKAQSRALRFFNTNPTLSGLTIGAALRLEEDMADSRVQEKEGSLIIGSLASVLAAHGDLLFWQAWLPFCCLIGFALTLMSLANGQVTLAPLLIPALFCLLSWPARIGGIFYGYKLGSRAFELIQRFRAARAAEWTKRFNMALTGFLIIYGLKTLENPNKQGQELIAVGAVSSVLFFTLAQRIWPKIGPKSLYLLIVLGLGLTAFVM